MRRGLIVGAAVSWVCGWSLAAAWAEAPPPTEEVSDQQIARWVEELDSDTFTTRRRATERLILAGRRAVDAVVAAVDSGSLETVTRGIYILQELTLSATDHPTEQAAYAALERIASRKVTAAARRALATLRTLDEARQLRARRYLEQLGADFGVKPLQVNDRLVQEFPAIILGSAWSGQPRDLDQLRWITQLQPTTMNGRRVADKWFLVLQGEQVNDQWLLRLKGLPNVGALKLKRTAITDAGTAHLKDFQDLRYLELLYNRLTDQALTRLAPLTAAARIKLFGGGFSESAVQQLRRQLAQVTIDHRKGAFLGIGAMEDPLLCRVRTVQAGSAAAKAGLELGDVVTHYRGEPVRGFDDLTRLIAANAPGDTVTVNVLRGTQPLKFEVTLGEWE